MSKSVFAAVAASVAGLAVGLTFTVVFNAGYGAFDEVTTEVKANGARLDRMERVLLAAITATRREPRRVEREASDAGAAAARPDGRASAAPGGDGAPAAGANHLSRDDVGQLAAKDTAALAPLAGWAGDEAVRRRWLFASEKTALDAFGGPDEVATHGSSESWIYWIVDQSNQIGSEYRLKFNGGRLVEAAIVKWERPRSVPIATR